MAIEARLALMADVRKQIEMVFSKPQVDTVIRAMESCMGAYDIMAMARRDVRSDDMLEAFLSAKKIEGKTVGTLSRYEREIKNMMRHVNVPTNKITVFHLRQYLSDEKSRGLADTTLEGAREIICSYFNWLQRENLIDKNPVANLCKIKCAKKVMKAYAPVELDKLKHGCSNVRDLSLILFLNATGCRIGEVLKLNRDDLNLERRETCVDGKGKKERIVCFDEVTAEVLRTYLQSRKDNNEALFVSLREPYDRLQQGGTRAMLNRVASKTGVEHVHPHKFRRTLATTLAGKGMPIQEIACILGHDKLDTTMKYVVMNHEDVRHSYNKYF